MKWFYFLALFVVVIIGTGFLSFGKRSDPANLTLDKYADVLAKKYGWKCVCVTEAVPGGVLKAVGLKFEVPGPLPQEKIRELLINAAHDLKEYANQNSLMKKQWEVYPVDIKRVSIVLFFIGRDKQEILNPNIGGAAILQGNLCYRSFKNVYNEKMKMDYPKEVFCIRETYEEALQALGMSPEQN